MARAGSRAVGRGRREAQRISAKVDYDIIVSSSDSSNSKSRLFIWMSMIEILKALQPVFWN